MNRWQFKDAVMSCPPPSRPGGLSAAHRLVMLVLILRADTAAVAIPPYRQPTQDELVQETGLARSSLQRVTEELESMGWIIRKRGSRRQPMTYELTLPALFDGPIEWPDDEATHA